MKNLVAVFFLLTIGIIVLIAITYRMGDDTPVKVVVYEITNLSPREFSEKHPELYLSADSYIKQSRSPKWERRYRYVIISQEASDFSGDEYLQNHPYDAVDMGNSLVNMFVIFTDDPPDEQIFNWR